MSHFPLEPIEKASVDELRALQFKRLKATLHHAYRNAPAYRRKFDSAGVHPDDLKSLADLRHFPFTTKADLRYNYPFGMFAVPREQCVRLHAQPRREDAVVERVLGVRAVSPEYRTSERALEVLDRRHRDRVDHLLMELRVPLRR